MHHSPQIINNFFYHLRIAKTAMSTIKKRYSSGASKRRQRLEIAKKHSEQIKETYSLLQMGFTNEPTNTRHDVGSSISVEEVVADLPLQPTSEKNDAVDLPVQPVQQISGGKDTEEAETATIPDVKLYFQNVIVSETEPEYENDIGMWQNITKEVQDFWCNRNPAECQHFDSNFLASGKQYEDYKRFFTQSMVYRIHVNGERIKREWLMYSPSTGNVYCFPCILFGDKDHQSQFSKGYSDW